VADTKLLYVGAVLLDDPPAGRWVVLSHPLKQRRADVEADTLEVAERGVRAIAFGVDAFVPVAIRGRPNFVGHDAGERVFARRLIKMAVNTERTCGHNILVIEYWPSWPVYKQEVYRRGGTSGDQLQRQPTLR